MSDTYVKNYEIGNIRLDLPYNHIIYEFPLLSFSDAMNTVGLSLIFNSNLAESNDFYMSNGHRLNLHKRIIIRGGGPGMYENGDGSRVNLIKQQNPYIYTFDDDSQRILRGTGQAYILENPDYSKETYTTLGRLMSVTDKYGETVLTYTYSSEGIEGKLTEITYRTNKVIRLSYNNIGVLGSIKYICNGMEAYNISLAYDGLAKSIVTLPSGVVYHTSYYAGEFEAYSGVKDSTYSHRVTCVKATDSITVERFIGTNEVDRTIYSFIGYDEANGASIINVTDFQGVTTRAQYRDRKPLYVYETGSASPMFYDNKYMGTVQINGIENAIKNYGFMRSLSPDQGLYMTKYDASQKPSWHSTELRSDNNTYMYFLSGWIRITESFTEDKIRLIVTDQNYNTAQHPIKAIDIDKPPINQWVFINVAFNYNKSALYVYIDKSKEIIQTNDFRLFCNITQIHDEENNSKIDVTSRVLIINGEPISINDVTFLNCGTVEAGDKVFYEDILKYKINQSLGVNQNEFYFNKCQKVVSLDSPNPVTVRHENQEISLTECYLGIKRYNGIHTIMTRIREDIPTDTGAFVIESYQEENNILSSVIYDEHLNIVSSETSGIKTEYTRNSKGLIAEQTVNKTGEDEIKVSYSYNSDSTILLSATDEFNKVTTYTTDPIWGVVTAAQLEDDIEVEDTYDAVFNAQMSRAFRKDSSVKEHEFVYLYNGLLGNAKVGSLNYTFEYDDGILTNVLNNSRYMGQRFISDDRRTVSEYYPEYLASDYSFTHSYDKYGRHRSTSDLIINTYKINPEYNSSGAYSYVNADTGSSKLAQSKDLITGITTKYAYKNDNILRIGSFNSVGAKVSEKIFEYDNLGRVKSKLIAFSNNQLILNSNITYATEETDPLADGRVSEYKYHIQNDLKAKTQNAYDGYKRISKKAVTLKDTPFIKIYSYDRSRLVSVSDTYSVSGSTSNFGTDSFTYDNAGRITTHSYTSAYKSYNKSYVYDPLGQLVRENNKGLDKTFIYCYDSIGNISSVKTYGYTLGGVDENGYDSIVESEYSTDRLTKFGTKSISYNSLGCPTSYDGKNYEWTKGRLSKITRGSAQQSGTLYENCAFTYDAYGRRLSKSYTYDSNPASTSDYSYTYNTTYNYDDSGRLLHETLVEATTYTGGGSSTREFVYLYDESGIIGVLYGSSMESLTPYYFRRNAQGDVTAIYDQYGNRKVEYAYDAWGNCTVIYGISHELASRNPIRYRGYYYDRETGLYYLNARYYNPQWRRFISPDDTAYLDPEFVNGLNLYCYCYNDPVNYADPSGHLALWAAALIGAGVLGLIGFGATMYSDYTDDGEIFNGSIDTDAYFWNTLVASSFGALSGGLFYVFGPSIIGFLGSNFTLGSYALASGEVVALTLSGAQISGGALVISAGLLMFSEKADRFKRKNTGSNTSQNAFIDHLQNKYGFNDKVRRRLHDKITKRGYSNKKVEEILKRMLGLY